MSIKIDTQKGQWPTSEIRPVLDMDSFTEFVSMLLSFSAPANKTPTASTSSQVYYMTTS